MIREIEVFIASREISATSKQNLWDMQFNDVAVALKSWFDIDFMCVGRRTLSLQTAVILWYMFVRYVDSHGIKRAFIHVKQSRKMDDNSLI